jgi:uncharacterized protein (TIGR03083 family)
VVAATVDEARGLVRDASRRFADLVRAAPDPGMRVRNSEWSVADAAAHVALGAEAYAAYADGGAEPVGHVGSINADNARLLTVMTDRDVLTLADRAERGVEALVTATSGLGADRLVQWHDRQATVGAVLGLQLGELLIHGDDVARTLGQAWPISRPEGTTVFEAIAQVAHWFVDPAGAAGDAKFEINLRGGPASTFAFAGGALTVEAGRTDRPDCRIWGDPTAMLLVLYKRRSQWGELARGRLLAGGRRPWLAFGFVDRFGGY